MPLERVRKLDCDEAAPYARRDQFEITGNGSTPLTPMIAQC